MYYFAYLSFFNKTIHKKYLYSFYYSIGFAVSDEIHQLFVPTRSGRVSDIFIDLVGIIIAYYAIRVINKFIKAK